MMIKSNFINFLFAKIYTQLYVKSYRLCNIKRLSYEAVKHVQSVIETVMKAFMKV